MPELPEVETICRGLVGYLAGRRLARVTVRRHDLRLPIPADFADKTSGRVVSRIGRRAKYLLIYLDDPAETVIIGHLGMSGRMLVRPSSEALLPHDHVVFETDADAGPPLTVVFHDPRRFGLLVLGRSRSLESHELFAELGPEPLAEGFGGKVLKERLVRRGRAPLKAALLDQTVVAGLGNIYVSEALHRAGLSPERAAGTLGSADMQRLAQAIRSVLDDAISAGGSTLRDYVQATGEIGSFQNLFRVYEQEGRACPRARCRGIVQRIVQSGRSTYFCPNCQK
jgi:formamidopyrimidine-DNA glycosylase